MNGAKREEGERQADAGPGRKLTVVQELVDRNANRASWAACRLQG